VRDCRSPAPKKNAWESNASSRRCAHEADKKLAGVPKARTKKGEEGWLESVSRSIWWKCSMASAKTPPTSHQLKITLLGIRPPIWRRFQVPSAIRLSHLHRAIQVVMGWTDSHLHQFEKDGQKRWAVVHWLGDEADDVLDEDDMYLDLVLKAEGDSMLYEYDFVDGWQHKIVLEKIILTDVIRKPVCLGGERNCPPEDVGGVPGYEEFLETIFDPTHMEFRNYTTWAGAPFQAEEFDLAAVNEALERMRWPVRKGR